MGETTATLHVEGVQKEVTIQEGTGQGTTLGPILCNFFFLPLLKQWNEMWENKATKMRQLHKRKVVTSLLHNFADDVAIILSNRHDTEEVA